MESECSGQILPFGTVPLYRGLTVSLEVIKVHFTLRWIHTETTPQGDTFTCMCPMKRVPSPWYLQGDAGYVLF